MASRVCVDTNILVYALGLHSPFQAAARRSLEQMYADGVELVIPLQVLKEFCVTISRDKIFVRPADTPTIVALAEQVLAEFPILNEPAAAGSLLVKLVERFHLRGRAIFDAAIVAVMQAHGVPALLTNNAAHFERFRELIEIIPLAA